MLTLSQNAKPRSFIPLPPRVPKLRFIPLPPRPIQEVTASQPADAGLSRLEELKRKFKLNPPDPDEPKIPVPANTDSHLLCERYPDIFEEIHPTKNKPRNFRILTYGMSTRLVWICRYCGEDYENTIANRCLKGQKHRKCSDKRKGMKMRDTKETFEKKARKIQGMRYNYDQSVYTDSHTKLKIFDTKCGKYFETTPQIHLAGSECSWCAHNRKKSTEELMIKGQAKYGDHYDYSEFEYKANYIHGLLRCKICSTKFWQTPACHLLFTGCKICHPPNGKTLEEFIEESKSMYGDRYNYSKTKYVSNHEKLTLSCNHCGNDFEQTPANHLSGRDGCKVCARARVESRGAAAVRKYLDDHKLAHDDECILEPLPNRYYDFRTFYINGRWYIIEFDGRQHFEFIPGWHGDIGTFEENQEIDKLKNHIAILLGYTVIRLSDDTRVEENLDAIFNDPSPQSFYVDNPEKYRHMYTDLHPEFVEIHCPRYSEFC